MKKGLPYIIIILFVLIVGYVVVNNKSKGVSTFISLNKKDKNPYGTFVFYESLKAFFPKATFKNNYDTPGDNKVFGDIKPNQLYVVVLPEFDPYDYEFDDLISFIERGNNVFISTFHVNNDVESFIKAQGQVSNFRYYPFGDGNKDTMSATLANPPFATSSTYLYPGTLMEGYFSKTEPLISQVLGKNDKGQANFMHLKKGNGNLYIHLSPLLFSNYFLLYNNNIQYFEKVFSVFPQNTPLILWDEYFNHARKDSENSKKDWLNAIMQNRSFSAGIITALALLLIYTLIEMRRKQRIIPVMEKPVNDSLEFVKTIGLLYYEKGDHYNLAQKISTYFLEHVRSRYKIFSKNLDRNFVQELSYKSGIRESLVKDIITRLNRLQGESIISEVDLIELQNSIEEFYDNE